MNFFKYMSIMSVMQLCLDLSASPLTLSFITKLTLLALFSPLLSFPHTPQHTMPCRRRYLIGRQVLEPPLQEQRGGQALPRRAAPEGEPDLRPRRLPGAGERSAQAGSGRHEEGVGPLSQRPQQVREPARRLVRRRRRRSRKSQDREGEVVEEKEE